MIRSSTGSPIVPPERLEILPEILPEGEYDYHMYIFMYMYHMYLCIRCIYMYVYPCIMCIYVLLPRYPGMLTITIYLTLQILSVYELKKSLSSVF